MRIEGVRGGAITYWPPDRRMPHGKGEVDQEALGRLAYRPANSGRRPPLAGWVG
jgi:hypothetical protein